MSAVRGPSALAVTRPLRRTIICPFDVSGSFRWADRGGLPGGRQVWLDADAQRLLWVGRKRTKATLRRFLRKMGPSVCEGIGFVCSDMGKAYLEVVRVHLPKAVQILDAFHIGRKLNAAVDAVRRQEASLPCPAQAGRSLAACLAADRRAGKKPWLTDTRWILLRRWKNLRDGMRETMKGLLRRGLNIVEGKAVYGEIADLYGLSLGKVE